MEDVVHDAGGEAILLNHGTGLPQAKTPHLADLEACLHLCSIQYGQHWKEVRSRPELTLLRPRRWIVTIPSLDQWLATIGNH